MRGNFWLIILFPLVVILLLVIIFWNWDRFIPLVDAQASAELGRKVTMQHLHVGLGRGVTVTATGITIANPSGFPANEPPLATIDRLRLGRPTRWAISGTAHSPSRPFRSITRPPICVNCRTAAIITP